MLTAAKPPHQRPLFIMALLGVLFGISLFVAQIRFLIQSRVADALVVARTEATFTLQYKVDGREFEVSESLPGDGAIKNKADFEVGAATQVLYLPTAPERAQWRSSRRWVFSAIIVVMSALFALTILRPKILK
jgi:hypothetical protein